MSVQTVEHQTGWIADASTFGARLALIRQRMGWGNIDRAARACGIAPETWRSWERDGREPHRLTTVAKQISGATGCDYLWLVFGPDRGAGVNEHYRPLSERVIARVAESSGHLNGRVANAPVRSGSPIRAKQRRPRALGPTSRIELSRV